MLRRLVTPTVLTATITAAMVGAAVIPAAADTVQPPESGTIAQELEDDGVFIDPAVGDAIPAAEENALEAAATGAESPVYYVILPTGSVNSDSALNALMEPVMADVGDGVYGVLAGSEEFRVLSPNVEDTAAIREIALREGGRNQVDTLVAIPDAVQEVEDAAAAGAASLWFLLAAAVVIAGGIFLFVRSNRRKQAERKAKELAEIKQMATEDVVRLGEDVARLEIDLSAVDDETRADYSRAMDAYDQAKSRLDTIREPEEIRQVTNSLEDGRYYMTATRARLNGLPVPERRGPCFFNPQHGPSAEDVTWAPPGGSPRSVTACASCARAVNSGLSPDDVRMVEVDGRRVAYYDAGPAYSPYAGGYFGMDMMMGMFTGMMMGSMMSSMMGMGMGDGDFGGGDFGGGDFGGGDFGGGDFGGFDF